MSQNTETYCIQFLIISVYIANNKQFSSEHYNSLMFAVLRINKQIRKVIEKVYQTNSVQNNSYCFLRLILAKKSKKKRFNC